MIFGTIGASIDFSLLPAGVVGRAVLIVVTGAPPFALVGRVPSVLGRAGFNPVASRSQLTAPSLH